MRKLSYALATLATVAIGAPTAASAGGFGVYVGDGGYRYMAAPASVSMNTTAACAAAGTTATTIMTTGTS